MLSRLKAERTSSELLTSAQREQQMAAARATRFLVLLYPTLKRLPPTKRRAALVAVQRGTFRRWFVWLPLVVSAISTAVYTSASTLHGTGAGRVLELLAIALIWLTAIAAQVRTRASLRNIANAGREPAKWGTRIVG